MGDSVYCCVCSAVASYSFTKYDHEYYKCVSCGTVFTPSLDMTKIITENDYSLERNNERDNTERLRRINTYGNGGKTMVDFGCGDSIFVSFLRKKGYTTLPIDKSTDLQLNQIASNSVDAINMVEVIEHIFTPHVIFKEFRRILKPGGVVYVETSLYRNNNPETWGYCDPRYGHITMYTLMAFEHLATTQGFIFSVYNPNVFIFTSPK